MFCFRILPPLLLFFLVAVTTIAQTVGILQNEEASLDGYTVLAPNSTKTTYLIDNCGYIVHEWEGSYTPGMTTYLQEDGSIVRSGKITNAVFSGGGSGGNIEHIAWDGTLLWTYNYSDTQVHQHHDIEVLPNGNILILAWEFYSSAAAIAEGRDPGSLQDGELWPEHIVEIEPSGSSGGTIVWEWHMMDHLIQDFSSTANNFGVVADHPELLDVNWIANNGAADWQHMNAIGYNPTLDQIVLSSKKMNEIYIIDHSTTTAEAEGHSGGTYGKGGDFLYRWGNPEVYDRGDASDQTLYGQHDVQWIADGLTDAGKLMVFNNSNPGTSGNYSSIDIIEPIVDGPGMYTDPGSAKFGPQQYYWSYKADTPTDFYSPRISGAQRLSNGNTLICEGINGRVFETTPQYEIVWEYISPINQGVILSQGDNPTNNGVFRAYRFERNFIGFEGKDLTPMDPIELNPTASSCAIIVEDQENGLSKLDSEKIMIYPNPTNGIVHFKLSGSSLVELSINDALGNVLDKVKLESTFLTFDLSDYPAGLYTYVLQQSGSVSLRGKLIKH